MAAMAWIGGAMSVLGLAGVLWCIRKAAWLRRAELDGGALQNTLNRLVFVHTGAVGVAFLGLGLLAAGLILR